MFWKESLLYENILSKDILFKYSEENIKQYNI